MYTFIWFDLITVAIFALFIIYYKRMSKIIADQAEADDITTADYAIYVTGFSETDTTKEELKQHFEQYGKIVEI